MSELDEKEGAEREERHRHTDRQRQRETLECTALHACKTFRKERQS